MSDDPFDIGPTRRHLTPGSEVFGRYELLEQIGAGKLGEVWKAKDKRLDLTVAIKLMENFPQFAQVSATAGRALGLTHPNIVRTYGFEGDENLCGFIMEYVKGQTLASLLRSNEPPWLEVTELRPWATQLFTALKFAWEHGKLVHGDLRPGNLFVTSAGTLKVAEFGLAVTRQGEPFREDAYTTSNFSLPCLSPQRIAGEVPHHTDDIYAAGACLYEALTGKSVFPGGNVLMQIQRKVPPSVAERRAELEIKGQPVPGDWESLIARCLEKERGQRPGSAAEVLIALNTISDTTAVRSGTGPGWTAKLSPKAAAGGATLFKHPLAISAAVVALFALLAYLLVIKPKNDALESMRFVMKRLDQGDTLPNAAPEERLRAWNTFEATCSARPVSFTDQDDLMVAHATERSEHWSREMRRLADEEEDRKRKIEDSTTRLRAAMVQQIQADTNESFSIADRLAAWETVMKQFGASGHPDTKEYNDLLVQISAAQKKWLDKDVAKKKEASDLAAKMQDEARAAETRAQLWRDNRESAWAEIATLCADPNVLPAIKLEKLIAFQPTLTDAPAGTEKRASELLTLANQETNKYRELVNVETPKEPLKPNELLADSPVKDQPDAVQRAYICLVQEKLKEKGLYKDTPDGVHGRGSHTALVTFQKDSKTLIANAKVDAATSKALGLDQPDLAALADQGKKLAASAERSSSSSGRTRRKTEPAEEPGFWNKVGKGFANFGRAVGDGVKKATR